MREKTKEALGWLFIGAVMVLIIFLILNAPDDAIGDTIWAEFSPKLLRHQTTGICSTRTRYMAEDFPDVFWAEHLSSSPCVAWDRNWLCFEDGCTKERWRFRGYNEDSDTLICMGFKDQDEFLTIERYDQWVDDTYKLCWNEWHIPVEIPGAYVGGVLLESHQDVYPIDILDRYGWSYAYENHLCPVNDNPDPWEQDLQGSRASVGLFLYAHRETGDEDFRNWASLVERYIDLLEGRPVAWNGAMTDAILWYRDNIEYYDIDRIIGRVGVAVESSSWGSIKRMYK